MTTQTRVALVTGGNRGIGFEICRQLAQTGVEVVLGARDAEKARAAASRLTADGLSVEPSTLDVSSEDSIRRAVERIDAEHGRLDILVNNAGIFLDKDGRAETIDLDRVRQTMETNTYGPILLCQAAVPMMRSQGYGRIVNLASELGSLTNMETLYPAYRMSKTALITYTRVLANELAGKGILVNSMCPGWVKTEMGGPNADREIEDSADTTLWLATLPDDGPTGGFFKDRKPLPW
jgi:NAD(P)-dependent dehydrogenase (short-subunit alcohol dehydrogenase family)